MFKNVINFAQKIYLNQSVNVLKFRKKNLRGAGKMDVIRFAVCGAGQRGHSLVVNVLTNIDGVEICAIYDPYTDKAEKVCEKVNEKKGYSPNMYSGVTEMLEKEKPDAVLVASSWDSHIKIAAEAMEKGIPVALEVGGAYNEEECRSLVDAYERTKTPFMFMENCCFGRDELLAAALVKHGVLGKPVYCHGAYMHDLREEISYGKINRHYRLNEYLTRNRDNYPTHDLGPIAKILNINRGNRMVSLSARSSGAFGLVEYVKNREDLSELHGKTFAQGDVIDTIITCENGELISLRLDTTLPGYYSREFTVRGTRGSYFQDTNMVYEEGKHKEIFETIRFVKENIDNAEKYYDKYLPEMWKSVSPEALKASHGGMDYFEFQTFCDCLRAGREMPIDVYDAAAWMSIAYLTEKSIALGGASVEIPDFTNGKYKTRPPKDVVEL